MDELNILVEALEGDLGAVQRWGVEGLGLMLPPNVTLLKNAGDSKSSNGSNWKEVSDESMCISQKPVIDIHIANASVSGHDNGSGIMESVNPEANNCNTSCCSEGTKEILATAEQHKLDHSKALEVADVSEQRQEDFYPSHVKDQCEVGNHSDIPLDIKPNAVDLEYCKVRSEKRLSSVIDMVVSGTVHEGDRWYPDLNVEQPLTEYKAMDVEGIVSSNDTKSERPAIKEERSCSSDIVKRESQSLAMHSDACGMDKTLVDYERMSITKYLMRSSPECGSSVSFNHSSEVVPSSGFSNRYSNEASFIKDAECIRKSSAKLFGVDLQQIRPCPPSSSDDPDNRPNGAISLQVRASDHADSVLEKDHERLRYCIEPLHFGTVMFGKQWCSKKAIFPKGFRSRVRFLSVLDPTKTCSYISEVLDAGLLGPLFKVTVEEMQEVYFMHASAVQCWDMVRERLNQEITRLLSRGKQEIPQLQPPESIDGLEMFGFLSPSIIQVIEAFDPYHRCSAYWASKSNAHLTSEAMEVKNIPVDPDKSFSTGTGAQKCLPLPASPGKTQNMLFGVDLTKRDKIESETGSNSAVEEVQHILGGLFQKASLEELRMMQRVLGDGSGSNSWRVAFRTLLNEIQKNVHK